MRKSRTLKAAKATMLEAVRDDCAQRFGSNEAADKVHIHLAYSGTDFDGSKHLEAGSTGGISGS